MFMVEPILALPFPNHSRVGDIEKKGICLNGDPGVNFDGGPHTDLCFINLLCNVREERTFFYPQGSFGWTNNQIDMKQINRENNQI